jgi:hypothetical protein
MLAISLRPIGFRGAAALVPLLPRVTEKMNWVVILAVVCKCPFGTTAIGVNCEPKAQGQTRELHNGPNQILRICRPPDSPNFRPNPIPHQLGLCPPSVTVQPARPTAYRRWHRSPHRGFGAHRSRSPSGIRCGRRTRTPGTENIPLVAVRPRQPLGERLPFPIPKRAREPSLPPSPFLDSALYKKESNHLGSWVSGCTYQSDRLTEPDASVPFQPQEQRPIDGCAAVGCSAVGARARARARGQPAVGRAAATGHGGGRDRGEQRRGQPVRGRHPRTREPISLPVYVHLLRTRVNKFDVFYRNSSDLGRSEFKNHRIYCLLFQNFKKIKISKNM